MPSSSFCRGASAVPARRPPALGSWASPTRRAMRAPAAPAAGQGPGSPPSEAKPRRRGPPGPPPGMAPGPDPNAEVVKIEEVETQAFEGVVQIDRGDKDGVGTGRVAALAGGDFAALLTFACVGHFSHSGNADFGEITAAALPFWIGWFAAAPFLGAYSPEAQKGASGAGSVIKTWAVGVPAGIAVRCLMKGYVPEKSFFIVAMTATLVFISAWRTAYAAKMGSDDTKSRRNKSGGVLELFSLIGSLTRRW